MHVCSQSRLEGLGVHRRKLDHLRHRQSNAKIAAKVPVRVGNVFDGLAKPDGTQGRNLGSKRLAGKVAIELASIFQIYSLSRLSKIECDKGPHLEWVLIGLVHVIPHFRCQACRADPSCQAVDGFIEQV